VATFIVPATESTALVFIAVSLHVAAVACRMHASTVSARGAAATLRDPVLPAYFFYLAASLHLLQRFGNLCLCMLTSAHSSSPCRGQSAHEWNTV